MDDGGRQHRLDVLSSFFQVPHNTPSTPERSLTGEVRERTIWAYWAQGYDGMPDLFKLCVATWQHHNPHWDVRILDKSTVFEYLSASELPNRFTHLLSHQTASDCVRLALLARYGGVWLDVNIIMRTNLDSFCWEEVATRRKAAAVFFHPYYGTERFEGRDLTESWFLATRRGNPFFVRWRDLLCELLHNRLDTDGLLEHPLYEGLDLSGIDRLNQEFAGLEFDFREYLAIHSMCHRLIETEARARAQWRGEFRHIDAALTAFRLQLRAQELGRSAAEVLLSRDPQAETFVDGVPLIKLTTPHYGPLLLLPPGQLVNQGCLLGRLLCPPAVSSGCGRSISGRVSAPSTESVMRAVGARVPRGTRGMAFAGMAAAAMSTQQPL